MIWLASYPKSGNTWLRSVYTALVQGDVDINGLVAGAVSSARGLFDTALGIRSSDLSPDEADSLRPAADDAAAARIGEDRWRKIHDALFPGPTGLPVISPDATRIALYVIRDPRDVAISYAHHAGMSHKAAVECLATTDSAVAGDATQLLPQMRQCLGTWSEHVLSWVDQDWFPVHVIRYEDCITAPVKTFREAFVAGGLCPSEAEVADAVARASWDRLKEQEAQAGFRERSGRDVSFFRRGKAGSWKEELSPELAQRVARDHGEVMARFGYLP